MNLCKALKDVAMTILLILISIFIGFIGIIFQIVIAVWVINSIGGIKTYQVS